MAKSRKRGGAKAHRKRVNSRNENIDNMQKHIQKKFEDELEKLRKEEEAKQAEQTEVDNTNDEDMSMQDENTPLDIKI